MNRGRVKPSRETAARARIGWVDGRYRVECAVRGASMELAVYYGSYLVGQERVASVGEAWTRATEICSQLNDAGELPADSKVR